MKANSGLKATTAAIIVQIINTLALVQNEQTGLSFMSNSRIYIENPRLS